MASTFTAACSRRPPEPPSAPRQSQPEIPADASIRLITDPMPAAPPRDAAAVLAPMGNAPAGDPMMHMIPIPPDANAAPMIPR